MMKFHYTYIIMSIGFILTGYYLNLIVFTSLIIFHELGHYTLAKIQKFNVANITIYPYGGLTKIDDLINKDTNQELLIAISGIIFQLIFFLLIIFLYRHNAIREYTFNLYQEYNRQLIFFNLLPIHPLDGSKILNLLLSKSLPYHTSNKLTIIISIIVIIILLGTNIYNNNYTYIMIVSILLDYIYKYSKNLKHIYNRFLLERYLYKITYPKKKIIKKPKKMYKNNTHIIKITGKYQKEQDFFCLSYPKKRVKIKSYTLKHCY